VNARELPNGASMIKVDQSGGHVYVTAANGHFPPRVEYSSPRRWTALVPLDRIRQFADTRLDAPDRAALLALLDVLAPWRQPRDKGVT